MPAFANGATTSGYVVNPLPVLTSMPVNLLSIQPELVITALSTRDCAVTPVSFPWICPVLTSDTPSDAASKMIPSKVVL